MPNAERPMPNAESSMPEPESRVRTGGAPRGFAAVLCALCLLHVAFGIGAGDAHAQRPNFMTGFSKPEGPPSNLKPEQLKEVSFRQRLNGQLPLDATFTDEFGRPVTLGSYFGSGRPVIVAFVYFTCPMLCTQVMNGISASLRALPFTAGEEFEVVVISFDPGDTPADALEKKRSHLEYWKTENTSAAWHFLTGDEATIARVTSAAGFTYKWDEVTGQYAHVSGLLVTTPGGRLSRYFYGVEYSPKELRLALVESGQGRVGSPIDELLLFCYHYDPETGRYGAAVMNLVRLGGVLTLGALAAFFIMSWRRDPHGPMEGRV
jgi:protein SCO1/2